MHQKLWIAFARGHLQMLFAVMLLASPATANAQVKSFQSHTFQLAQAEPRRRLNDQERAARRDARRAKRGDRRGDARRKAAPRAANPRRQATPRPGVVRERNERSQRTDRPQRVERARQVARPEAPIKERKRNRIERKVKRDNGRRLDEERRRRRAQTRRTTGQKRAAQEQRRRRGDISERRRGNAERRIDVRRQRRSDDRRQQARKRQADWRRERGRTEWRRIGRERRSERRANQRRRQIVRRTTNQTLRRRQIRNRRGELRYARSRRYWVRDKRYRNRFRHGRSIYFLPPAVAALAAGAYYLSGENASYDDYVDTFMAPPVRRLERRYTLDEIVADPEIRSAMRSIDLSMIRFQSGSDRIPDNQYSKLENLADAIRATLSDRPNEVFLIAGHTDAVGSDESNLELSERRAVTVLEILISEFGIPAKNLESVGYGEQYLLIDTDGSEVRNRRVVVRAIGVLLANRQ
jgi:outer membrane protein OmpA-like peptidoglycan-associated protein